MSYPSWWAAGVRVVGEPGAGVLTATGRDGWLVQLDAHAEQDSSYVIEPEPTKWRPEVRQTLTPSQRDRIVHDAERALLCAFGCNYVPEYAALADSLRARGALRPRAVNRPELDGLQAIIRGAVAEALAPYTAQAF